MLLLRHGESASNAARTHSLENPRLTELGREQAGAWDGPLGTLGIQCMLVSPLLRAVETAALTGLWRQLPMELCAHTRELYWAHAENSLGNEEQVRALCDELCGCTDRVSGIARAFDGGVPEHGSIAALKRVLRGRTEQTVLIVCHWGVIKELCGEETENGTLVECARCQATGELRVQCRRAPIQCRHAS